MIHICKTEKTSSSTSISDDIRKSTQSRPIVFVGNFSPPLTGQTFLNEKLAEILSLKGTPLKILNIQPAAQANPLVHFIARAGHSLALPYLLLRERLRGSKDLLYALIGGRSRILDVVFVSTGRLLGYNLTLYHHSSEFATSRSLVVSLMLAVAGNETRQVMASRKMSNDFAASYGIEGQIVIIDNSAYIEKPVSPLRAMKSPFRIGLLSNLTKEKGLNTSVATLDALISLGVDCELVLAGPAFDTDAKKFIDEAKQKYQERIQVLGPVFGESKDAFFCSIDAFLFPSTHKHETQSLVVPEAQSYGRPVIVHDHRYVGENIPKDLQYCIIPVEQDYPTQAAAVIKNWINNPLTFSADQQKTLDHFGIVHEAARTALLTLNDQR